MLQDHPPQTRKHQGRRRPHTCKPAPATVQNRNQQQRRRPTCSPRSGPSRTSGDSLPAAASPSIWWKWLQNRTLATVTPTSADAAHTAGGTACPAATCPACRPERSKVHSGAASEARNQTPCSAGLPMLLQALPAGQPTLTAISF